jgi:hypothetical protein
MKPFECGDVLHYRTALLQLGMHMPCCACLLMYIVQAAHSCTCVMCASLCEVCTLPAQECDDVDISVNNVDDRSVRNKLDLRQTRYAGK